MSFLPAWFLVFLGQGLILSEAFFMSRLSVAEFQASPILDEPVVIENALDWRGCQYWWKHILTRSGNEDIAVKRRDGVSSISLQKAAHLVRHESSHYDPIYVSSQGSSCSTDQLPFYDLLDSLFEETEDWLPLFSLHAPITETLVLAGEGASCPLQRHPYACFCLGLTGNSLWRLLPPEQDLKSESIDSEAWDGFSFSTGQQVSKGELFGLRHKDVEVDDSEKTAFIDEHKFIEYQHLAEQNDMMRSNLAIEEPWTSTVVLDGDLLVIPPNWWYQSYNLETSISLESQRCHDLSEFLQHIVKGSNLDAPPRLLQRTEFHTAEDAKQSIDELFELLEEQKK